MWVLKIKTKARKLRDSLQATGGGPALDPLTPMEEKVIEIVGSATIYGFTSREFPSLVSVTSNLCITYYLYCLSWVI